MSKIRFRSLPSTEFSIAVAQAGAKAELKTDSNLTNPPDPEPAPEPELDPAPTPDPTPRPVPTDPELQVEILVNRTTGIAPAGIMFRATAAGFPVPNAKRDLRYKWDFGDPNSEPFSAPDGRFDATVNGRSLNFRDSNIAYTYQAAHTFFPKATEFNGRASKQFTVTCTVQDRNGNVAQGSREITIENPDRVFANTTVGVDPDGDTAYFQTFYPGRPVYRTIQAAWQALGGSGGRILIRRGKTVTQGVGKLKDKDKVFIGVYGGPEDPKPMIDAIPEGNGGFKLSSGMSETAFWGFDIAGDWNVLSETSPSGNLDANGFAWESSFTTGFDTIHQVWVRNINGTGFYPQGKWHGGWASHIVISDCRVENYRNYGMLMGTTERLALVGFSVTGDPMKAQGYGSSTGTRNQHGPLRVTVARGNSWCIFDAIQLESWTGWSGTSSPYDYNKLPHPQPAFRFNPGESAEKGEPDWHREPTPFTLSRFIIEGGGPPVYPALRTPAYSPGTIDAGVIDKGIAISTAIATTCVLTSDFGTEVSNVLCVVPRMNMVNAKDHGAILGGNGNTPEKLTFRGISAVCWLDPEENHIGGRGAGSTDLHMFEPGASHGKLASLFHYPNGLTPNDLSAQLDLSHRLFAPKYPGVVMNDWQGVNGPAGKLIYDASYAAQDSFTQDGQQQASIVMPIPIEGTLMATKGEAPIDDIFGEIRPVTPHRGCVEPSSVLESTK